MRVGYLSMVDTGVTRSLVPNRGGIFQIFKIKVAHFFIMPKNSIRNKFEVGRGRLAILGWELMI